MATAVLSAVNDRFPAGTTVSVYAAQPGDGPPDAVPEGAVVTTAVVASTGVLTIAGLTAGARYWAYAEVSSDHRTVGFTAPPVADPTALELDRLNGITGTPIVAVERTFTETAGAGTTYTGTVALPAGATVLDIIIDAVALWTAGTSAELIVGDGTDPDGYFTAVDLKATDLLAGESLSFAKAGGVEGAYIVATHVAPRYSAAARSIIGVVTVAGTVGTAGRTRMTVIYSKPVTADSAAATKA